MTSVGGTTLSTDEQGGWMGERAWVDSPLSQGTSGGVSALFARPAWQSGLSVERDIRHRRLAPDVAAVADPFTGVRIVFNQQDAVGAGTSQAAPIWAALTVLMNQYLLAHGGHPLGNINPLLYRVAAGANRPAFRDISFGGNAVDFVAARIRRGDAASAVPTSTSWSATSWTSRRVRPPDDRLPPVRGARMRHGHARRPRTAGPAARSCRRSAATGAACCARRIRGGAGRARAAVVHREYAVPAPASSLARTVSGGDGAVVPGDGRLRAAAVGKRRWSRSARSDFLSCSVCTCTRPTSTTICRSAR